MDLQTAFNIVVTAVGFLGAFLLTRMWNAIEESRTANQRLTGKVGELEVLVAGQYVTRTEYKSDLSGISDSLKRIEDKLDSKADK